MRDPKDREVELSFWESIRSSDSAALIRTYLEKYPEGEFNALAQVRITELERGGAERAGKDCRAEGPQKRNRRAREPNARRHARKTGLLCVLSAGLRPSYLA